MSDPTIDALIRRLSDPDWRIRNLYTIINEDAKVIPFRPNSGQDWFFEEHSWWTLIVKARRLGFSTAIDLKGLDRAIFNPRQNVGLIDFKLPDARKKLAGMAFSYDTIGQNIPGLKVEQGMAVNAWIKDRFPCDPTTDELKFGNKSVFSCSTTFRGGALQYLHVSEFGPLAMARPQDAKDILTGALPAVGMGNMAFFESTHKGGKSGPHYDLIKEATARLGQIHNERQFKMLFFPFQRNPKNVLDPRTITIRRDEAQIFAEWENSGIRLTPEQKAFWANEFRTLKEDTFREFPACLADVFRAPVEGSIYGDRLTRLQSEGRLCQFPLQGRYPCVIAWDLGQADAMAMWCIQVTKTDIRLLNYYEASGEPVEHFARKLDEWKLRYPITKHLFPHDANHRSKSGRTFVGDAREAGITPATVVPVTPDVYIGINQGRNLLDIVLVHEDAQQGFDLLAGYRKPVVAAGVTLRTMPIHDHTSHCADAWRTFVEAYSQGMVSPHDMAVRHRNVHAEGGSILA